MNKLIMSMMFFLKDTYGEKVASCFGSSLGVTFTVVRHSIGGEDCSKLTDPKTSKTFTV